MQAITFQQFGDLDVLQMAKLSPPEAHADHVIVRVRATSVNVLDSRVREGKMGILVDHHFPKVPGSDLSGTVESVGTNVTELRPGDEVLGATNPFKGGAFAEFATLPESALTLKPSWLSFEQAAALPITGLAALYSLRDLGEVKPGCEVLIYGASGSAGLFAVQLGKVFGANVTSVCGTSGVDICRRMGADVVLDYKAETIPLRDSYEVIVDFSGKFPFDRARAHLSTDGRYIDPSPTIPQFIGSKIVNPFRHQKDLMLQTEAKTEDLRYLVSLVESGRLKITIAQTFELAEAQKAFRMQEAGGVLGKIVLTVP